MAFADDWTLDYADKVAHYIGTFTSGVSDSVWTGENFYADSKDLMDDVAQMTVEQFLDYASPSSTALQLLLKNDWHITKPGVHSLTGCSLQQTLTAANTIIRVKGNGTNPTPTDGIGNTGLRAVGADRGVTQATSAATGRVIDWYNEGAVEVWWIRVDSGTFNATNVITTDDGGDAGSLTPTDVDSGTTLHAEVRTIGTVASTDTVVDIEQDNVALTPWWDTTSHTPSLTDAATLPGAPHIDVLVPVQECGDLIDFGFVTVYLRKFSDLYSSFKLNCSGGGNNTLALGTNDDSSNTTAVATVEDWEDGTINTVSITYGHHTRDLGNGNGAQGYVVDIDGGSNTVAQLYEVLKYLSRTGETGTVQSNGVAGEIYRGVTLKLPYTLKSPTTEIAGGTVIYSDATNSPSAIVVGDDGGGSATGTLYVMAVRGTFSNGDSLDDIEVGAGGAAFTATCGTPVEVAPVEACPWGTFGGGVLTTAFGVNVSASASNPSGLILTDITGTQQAPPTTTGLTVANLVSGDSVGVYEVSGGDIVTSQYALAAGNNAGDTTIVLSTSLDSDDPASGYIIIGSEEHTYHYASYATDTLTLDTVAGGTCDSAGTSTTLNDSGNTFPDAKVGMMIENDTTGGWAQIKKIETGTITTTALSTGTWGDTNTFSINKLVKNYTATHDAFVPLIHGEATGTSMGNTYVYSADRDFRVRVRRYDEDTPANSIKEYVQDVTVSTTSVTANAIRNADAVVS